MVVVVVFCFFFFQAEDGIRDYKVTGVQTCALPISLTPWQMAWGKLLGAPLPAWLYMLWCALAVLATSTGQPGGSEEQTPDPRPPCRRLFRLLLEKKNPADPSPVVQTPLEFVSVSFLPH